MGRSGVVSWTVQTGAIAVRSADSNNGSIGNGPLHHAERRAMTGESRLQLARQSVTACGMSYGREEGRDNRLVNVDALPPRWAEYAHRLPCSLADLKASR